jgi:hypothetical protein
MIAVLPYSVHIMIAVCRPMLEVQSYRMYRHSGRFA